MTTRHPHALRGIGLMLLAVSTFSCLDATSKYLTALYAVPAIVWARYVFQMLLMAVALGPRMRMGLLRTSNLRLQLIRGAVLTASSLFFLTALSRMPLAEAASITFMAPPRASPACCSSCGQAARSSPGPRSCRSRAPS